MTGPLQNVCLLLRVINMLVTSITSNRRPEGNDTAKRLMLCSNLGNLDDIVACK